MKLKNVNLNGVNVAASNLNNAHIFFGEIAKIELKNKCHMLSFQ
jgi:hypothetical protein